VVSKLVRETVAVIRQHLPPEQANAVVAALARVWRGR
jgi:hypothetical protein